MAMEHGNARAGWKTWASDLCAILLGVLFLSAGVWKITDPLGWAQRVVQLQVPARLALPATLSIGVAEVFAAILLFLPQFRRWGAYLTSVLLIAFMAHIGWHYKTLLGEDCSCFPWIQRSVGPGFFISDAAMLAMAAVAGFWARPSRSYRLAGAILGVVALGAVGLWALAESRQSGIVAPETVTVEGKPYSLREGRVFLYFYDPQCMHCFHAAEAMAKMHWKEARIVAAPTAMPEYARNFLNDTGLKAELTFDTEKLREVFRFGDPPYGVLLDNGRAVATILAFEGREPKATLQRHGYVE
jgi:uncharacterized membrane protein YphA (DoxX/SURF4 family)